MDRIRLLIDTDVGGDIDDALCLAMALNTPRAELLGVTTVYADNAWRTGLARDMLKVWGREDVPVRRGAERPMLGRYPHDRGLEPLPNEAVPFIIDTCRENPGMTVLAIGPLTNVALAVLLAPDICVDTRFVLMGGMTGEKAHPEWNIQCDPEAAAAVLDYCRPEMVGLNVTERCRLTREEADALVAGGSPRQAFLRGEMGRFFRQFDFLPVLHDPLALAGLLWDGLLTWEERPMRVELGAGPARGMTVSDGGPGSHPVRWAAGVDAAEATRRIVNGVRGEPQD
ncbi:MAG TPA: nucleoside hydrolase [Candidatus Limnocylindria bacterium]|nr:nucleoside hydrolase [Candidatus Limnocylindria bacterium]